MDMMISTELEKKIMDHRDQMMEGIKYRVSVGWLYTSVDILTS